jgi:hypothetical protein
MDTSSDAVVINLYLQRDYKHASALNALFQSYFSPLGLGLWSAVYMLHKMWFHQNIFTTLAWKRSIVCSRMLQHIFFVLTTVLLMSKDICDCCKHLLHHVTHNRPPLCSSGQSSWLQTHRSRVRFPTLPDFLLSSGSGTGSTQPLWG